MAIEFARTHVISRGNGHSAVKAAAYRSGEKLRDVRADRHSDYSHRADDVVHSEILLPAGSDPGFADREKLWTAVEEREDSSTRRATAQLAKDHIIALPKELSSEQHAELAKSFAEQEFVNHGFVVDLNVHYHSDGNPHAHLMTTLRKLDGSEFGQKERGGNGNFYTNGKKVPDDVQLRHRWVEFQNEYFRQHDINLTVENNDGQFEPEIHVGPRKWMAHPADDHEATVENLSKISGRAAAILKNPEILVERVSDRKSVFTRHDLYRELHKLVDDLDAFKAIKSRLDNHSSLISIGMNGGHTEFFTSRAVVEAEKKIAEMAAALSKDSTRFTVDQKHIDLAFTKQSMLSDEQRKAVTHTLESNRLACVVGLAGAGKSTMLRSMREAAIASGHRVVGVALAGKAAEELATSAGIESRTLASFIGAHKCEKLDIKKGDIVVMDEAGMVNNKTMLAVMEIVVKAGAKLVMVGDGEQLQPIQAGSPFKVLTEKFNSAHIETIRRQRIDWQREATFDLAKGRGQSAFARYESEGFVHSGPGESVIQKLVDDYIENLSEGSSRAILAHRNKDVKAINEMVRDRLKSSGAIAKGRSFRIGVASTNAGIPLGTQIGDSVIFGESNEPMGYSASDRGTYAGEQNGMQVVQLDNGGELSFSPENAPIFESDVEITASDIELSTNDRILFTKNDSVLGVKNGMLGTLIGYEKDRVLIELDDGKRVEFSSDEYSHIEHGYATTIHKSQGMTVDHTYLLGSSTMDKHLGYVGLSRHRDSVNIYLPNEDFRRQGFGDLISRANHQQSVLDIVERQGLSFDEENIGRTEFVDTSPPSTGGNAMDTVAAATGEDSITVDQAVQTLESTRISLVEKMNHDADLTIREAERQSRIAERALDNHRASEPKQGLLSSKSRHQEWQSQLQVLEKSAGQAERAVKGLKVERDSSQEKYSREARREAARKHPEAAQVARTYKAIETKQKLMDRFDSLQTDIASSAEKGLSPDRVNRLHTQLDRVIKDLGADKGATAQLSSDERRSIQVARKKVADQQRARAIEERSRGGLER